MTDATDPRRPVHGGRVKRAGAAAAAIVLLALAVALLADRLATASGATRRPLVDVTQSEHGSVPAAILEAGEPMGQTFVAHHAGLTGVEIVLEPPSTQPLTLTLHLRSKPGADGDLASSVVRLPATGASTATTAAGVVRFDFRPLDDSHGRSYYAAVEASAPGVAVPLAEGSAYRDGAAYVGGRAVDAQTSFNLLYRPAYVAWGLLRSARQELAARRRARLWPKAEGSVLYARVEERHVVVDHMPPGE